MKKIILFLAAFILSSISVLAEGEPVVEYKSDDFTIKLNHCIGNRAAQVVKLEFVMVHNLPNQSIYFNRGANKGGAYDIDGNSYKSYVYGGRGYWGNEFYIPNNQPRKIQMQVDAILSRVEQFSSLVFTVSTTNGDVEVTLRDIPITWKY